MDDLDRVEHICEVFAGEQLDFEVEFVLEVDELPTHQFGWEEEAVGADGGGGGDELLREGLADGRLGELVFGGDEDGDRESVEGL